MQPCPKTAHRGVQATPASPPPRSSAPGHRQRWLEDPRWAWPAVRATCAWQSPRQTLQKSPPPRTRWPTPPPLRDPTWAHQGEPATRASPPPRAKG
eukprot:scaffold17368_cov136-Isochrysis_galbana.AAC.5